jgi:uncharacterized protein YjaZ
MEYSIKPEEHELREARQMVEGAMEAFKALVDKDGDIAVYLGWTSEEFVEDKLGGVSGTTLSKEEIVIEINSRAEDWEENLERVVAHEFAHTVFLESFKQDELVFNWQNVLFEAHAQHFAEEIFSQGINDWKNAVSEEELKELWPEVKESLSEENQYEKLFFGGENFPPWMGYTVAWRIGQKLLEKHELEDFPDLKRSHVIEAGDEIFG